MKSGFGERDSRVEFDPVESAMFKEFVDLGEDEIPADILGHPTLPLILINTFKGNVFIYERFDSNPSLRLKHRVSAHRKPGRKLALLPDQKTLISSSNDGKLVLVDIESGKVQKVKQIVDKEGEGVAISAIAAISMESRNNFSIAVGDEIGNVYIIIVKDETPHVEQVFEEHQDFISSLLFISHKKTLIASSGDGSITVIDTRKHKLIAHTKSFEDEIISLCSVKNASFIACGTGLGAVNLFSWNYWGKVQDRLKPALHSSTSIETMVGSSRNPNVLYSGGGDGVVRCIHIHPNRVDSVVGEMDDPIEGLAFICSSSESSPLMLAAIATNDTKVALFECPLVQEAKGATNNVLDSSSEDQHSDTDPSSSEIDEQPAKRANGSAKNNDNVGSSFFADMD